MSYIHDVTGSSPVRHTNEEKSQRKGKVVWKIMYKHDRDLNASINIKKLGHQLLKERKSDTLLECIPC